MRLLPLFAWLMLAAVVFATLAPIEYRPSSSFTPNFERLGTFAVLGFLFALAYPRRLLVIIALVLGAGVGLELLQLLAVGRHGTLRDLVFKLVGGGLGIAAAVVLRRLWQRFAPQRG